MKTFLTKFVPCFTSVLLSFCFFLFVLYRVSVPGLEPCLVITNPYPIFCIVLLVSVMGALSSIVVMQLLIQYEHNREFKKSALSRKLHSYVKRVIQTVPELRASIKKDVRISISLDEDIYQASAVGNNRILISYKWMLAATVSKKKLEELKSTLCHELSHIKDHCDTVWWKYPTLYFPRITKKALLKSWHNELRADSKGVFYYTSTGGHTRVYLRKMRFLRDLTQNHSKKERLGTHPCMTIRIGFILNNIAVTPDTVQKAFEKYEKYLEKNTNK